MVWLQGSQTVLHHAVEQDNLDVVKCLLSAGANVNAATEDGSTPLFEGFHRHRQQPMIECLVSAGANLHTGITTRPSKLTRSPLLYTYPVDSGCIEDD
eukprot:m.79403 g.79403  ORF g.79403 m.79403 type:complete len:98 (-) comp14514_c0_seq41:112-405(-)